jgi:hypothetical protein
MRQRVALSLAADVEGTTAENALVFESVIFTELVGRLGYVPDADFDAVLRLRQFLYRRIRLVRGACIAAERA